MQIALSNSSWGSRESRGNPALSSSQCSMGQSTGSYSCCVLRQRSTGGCSGNVSGETELPWIHARQEAVPWVGV